MMIKKIVISLLFIIIGTRIYYLNNIMHDNYLLKLNFKCDKYVYGASAPRGKIMDRNGVILVDNKGVKTIFYNKLKDVTIKDEINIAYKLANIVNVEINNNSLKNFWLVNNSSNFLITKDEWDLLEKRKISSQDINHMKLNRIPMEEINKYNDIDKKAATIYELMNRGYSYVPKEIISNLTDEEYSNIIEKKIKGINGSLKWVRNYPFNSILKDVFGNTGNIPKEEQDKYIKKGYNLNDIIGISYLESQYEEYLKGKKDLYKVNKDNTLSLVKEGESGSDVYLSIDINVQQKLENTLQENILKAKKYQNSNYFNEAYSIVSNPATGEIVALSGQKLTNNDIKNPFWQSVNTDLITKSYTVGSVVKAASISVGYKYKVIDINTTVRDSCIKLDNIPIKCSYKNLGRINDLSAISKSSNYYQFMIAIGITNNNYKYNMKLNTTNEDFLKYRSMFNEYGLGTYTKIDLPNEKIGIIGKNNSSDLLLNLSIGQYDTYTPIELSQYVNTVSSKGLKRTPFLMKKIVKKDKIIKEQSYDVITEVSLEDKYKERIKEGLRLAAKSGTARSYIDEIYMPAGKTGTSETFIDTNNDGIMDTKTISNSFIGFAPYDNPNFSIVVIAPDLYVDKNSQFSKMPFTRYVSKSISKFYFEKS